jgi:hypothetical protein
LEPAGVGIVELVVEVVSLDEEEEEAKDGVKQRLNQECSRVEDTR